MIKRFTLSGIALTMLLLAAGRECQAASVVLLGSDYLFSVPGGSSFPGLGFLNGVPLGGALGNTDTIVQRQSDAFSTPTIPIALTALQLETVAPVNFGGAGVDFYFVTLQSARAAGGPASLGSMTITQFGADDGTAATPEGVFASSIDVFFDIRKGALGGPIVFSSDLLITNSGVPWDATNPPGALLVTGPVGNQAANLHTGKSTSQIDFFPFGAFLEADSNGAVHAVQGASSTQPTPEPATSLLIGVGLLAVAALWKHKRG